MEINRSVTRFTYRIEQKPDGTGFIAKSDDPAQETIEGATAKEVEEKIGAKVMDMVGAQVGGLHLPGLELKVNKRVTITSSKEITPEMAKEFGLTPTSTSTPELQPPVAPSGESSQKWLWIVGGAAILSVLLYYFLHH